MLSPECLREIRSSWLPHMTDAGVDRLIDLLEKDSPLLIHGSFTRAVPMGCLATHIAWNHPATCHHTIDAGIAWLHHVAGLNPATSQLIRAWDRSAGFDFEIRSELLEILREYRQSSEKKKSQPQNRIANILEDADCLV